MNGSSLRTGPVMGDCFRNASQTIDAPAASSVAVLTTLCVGLTVLCCCTACVSLFTALWGRGFAPTGDRNEPLYLEMGEMGEGDNFDGPGTPPEPPARRGRCILPGALSRRLPQCMFASLVVLLLVVIPLGIVYWPQHPMYEICDNEVQWDTVISGLSSLKISADEKILISVENPNRLGFKVLEAHATFYFVANNQTVVVATMAFDGTAQP